MWCGSSYLARSILPASVWLPTNSRWHRCLAADLTLLSVEIHVHHDTFVGGYGGLALRQTGLRGHIAIGDMQRNDGRECERTLA